MLTCFPKRSDHKQTFGLSLLHISHGTLKCYMWVGEKWQNEPQDLYISMERERERNIVVFSVSELAPMGAYLLHLHGAPWTGHRHPLSPLPIVTSSWVNFPVSVLPPKKEKDIMKQWEENVDKYLYLLSTWKTHFWAKSQQKLQIKKIIDFNSTLTFKKFPYQKHHKIKKQTLTWESDFCNNNAMSSVIIFNISLTYPRFPLTLITNSHLFSLLTIFWILFLFRVAALVQDTKNFLIFLQ